jgi:Cu-Zn family superoxide dismutase
MVRSHLQQVNGISSADETKNITVVRLTHQGADDYVSQPAGNAGARVAVLH